MIKIKIILYNNNKLKDLKIFSRGLNRQVIKWLESGDKELLHSIKEEKNLRPFTISYLQEDKNYYSFYINLLEDNLEKVITQGMENLESEIIDLNYEKFELIGYEKIKSSNLELLKEKVEELLISKSFKIHFVSETAFSQKNEEGKRTNKEDINFEINKFFGFLISRINIHENFNYDKNQLEDLLNNSLELTESNLKTNNIILGFNHKQKMTISGFIGEISFKFKIKDLNKKRLIILLLLYSEWSGIGKKTGFGMGQTNITFL